MPFCSSRIDRSRSFSPTVAALAVALTACGSPADGPTRDALTALDHCDVRTAQADFASAHQADPHHPAAALGFALTDLAMLPEDTHVASILANLGFTGPVDMQALVFGSSGVLARLARNDTCDRVTSFIDTTVPYPPLRDSSIHAETLFAPGLTGETLRSDVVAVETHLAQDSAALETAANAMGTQPYAIQGSSCGQGTPVVLQKPELYAAAAALALADATVQIGLAYDWNIALAMFFTANDGGAATTQLGQALNDHLGHLQNAAAVTAARATLARGLALAVQAIDAAKAARTPVANGLLDWSQFPVERLDDLRRMVVSLQGVLAGPTPLADVVPQLTADVSGLFANPPDAARLSGPLFTTSTDSGGYVSLQLDTARVNEAVGGITMPTLWNTSGESASYQWTPNQAWNQFMSNSVVAPAQMLGNAYRCH